MDTPLQTDAYLERISYSGPREPTIETLRGLHRAHLLAVPFENLDIHIGREIVLDPERLVNKIVHERRGGFCYELNGAFATLLRALGFEVSLLSAEVATPGVGFTPPFDHLLLRVDLDEPWIADVGFGDCFVEPIRADGSIQRDGDHAFQVQRDDNHHILRRRDDTGDWKDEYRFTMTPFALDDFSERCQYHQTSPESHFRRNTVCSRLTPDGRISLTPDRLIRTSGSDRTETPIADQDAYHAALAQHFGIVLPITQTA